MGARIDQMMTAPEVLKPPRLHWSKNGKTKISVNWLRHPDQGQIPMELVAEYAGYTPEKIIETVLGSPPGKIADFLDGRGQCPLCDAERAHSTKANSNL